jgi:hypothetical protein
MHSLRELSYRTTATKKTKAESRQLKPLFRLTISVTVEEIPVLYCNVRQFTADGCLKT